MDVKKGRIPVLYYHVVGPTTDFIGFWYQQLKASVATNTENCVKEIILNQSDLREF